MEIEALPLEGLLKLTPRQFRDDRGVFWETWRDGMVVGDSGKSLEFVQENLSISKAGNPAWSALSTRAACSGKVGSGGFRKNP